MSVVRVEVSLPDPAGFDAGTARVTIASVGAAGPRGPEGDASTVPGPQGEPGVGVPAGGTTGQALVKASNADHDTEWETVSAGGGDHTDSDHADAFEALGAVATHSADTTNVHGIADTSVLATDAELTAHAADTTSVHGIADTSVLATNASVAAAIAALVDSAPGTLDTLNELAAALGDDPNYATTISTALAGKQPLDADLTAIAALTTTAFGRSLLEAANAAAGRTLLDAAQSHAHPYEASGAVATHEADTTNVHGIADTSALVESGDAAGGVLSGTYPNPGFAADMATQAELDAHAAAADPHTGYVLESALSASGKGFVNHGSTAGTARPSGYASVEWFGTVEPSNWIDGDTWNDPS